MPQRLHKKKDSKRQCKFTLELAKEFPFIKEGKILGSVDCSICNGNFNITSGGRRDITRHLNSDKHKTALLAASSSTKVSNFFRREEFGVDEKKLAAAEATFSFHTINHNHSFRSMDCTSKLIKHLYDKKFACARTKTEAIVKNVLLPFVMDELEKDLTSARFISIFSDASNHKEIKLFPYVVRYFSELTGIQAKIIDLVSLPGETSEMICESILDVLQRNNVKKKLVGYCGDNANTNFGGVGRKGVNNIFARLNEALDQDIVGVGCAAHIVHNAIQHAADLLPIDIEHVIVKIYSHFYIYTVRVNKLTEFCESAAVEYQRILGYSKTRWLALLPAIERILKLFDPLKEYFLALEKCPVVLQNFFKDESAELWLMFLHNQAALFHYSVKNIEGNSNTIMQVSEEITLLKTKLRNRLEDDYLPLLLRNQIRVLEENFDFDRTVFISHMQNFYTSCIDYLNLWTAQFSNVEKFN